MSSALVATVMVRTLQGAARWLREPPPGTDYLELRLDALAAPDAATVRKLLALPRKAPVIATCRAAAHGGSSDLDDTRRLELLAAAAQAGADLVDVEDGLLARLPASLPGRRLASCHLSRFVPRLFPLAQRVVGRGAEFAKLAVPAETPRQLAALLELQDEFAGGLSVVATGRLAEAGRVLLAARGAPLTYGAADAADPGHRDQPSATRLHDLFAPALLGPTSRFYAVVGRPIAHSLSPLFHNTVFRGTGRSARMVALDVERLAGVLEHAEALRLDGLAVTHPFKGEAVELADSALPGAAATGAANTLLRTPAGWQARNTDVRAAGELLPRLLRGWRRRKEHGRGGGTPWVDAVVAACWSGSPERRAKGGEGPIPRVLLLGAGGAARAILAALGDQEIELFVWARRLSDARELAAEAPSAQAVATPADAPADLVLNATPVGMPGVDGGELAAVLGKSVFRPGGVAVDLTYGGEASPFRQAAAQAGVPLVPGEVFFLLQARRQAEVFALGDLSREVLAEAAKRCGPKS